MCKTCWVCKRDEEEIRYDVEKNKLDYSDDVWCNTIVPLCYVCKLAIEEICIPQAKTELIDESIM